MSRDWRADAASAEEFFGLLGATVDQRLDRIAAEATAIHKRLHGSSAAAVNRWTVRQLDLCSTFGWPPPVELVRLVEHLLGVDKPERNGARKNPKKFIAAAHHLAQFPDATPGKIAHAIKYDQKSVIKGWLNDPKFQEIVGTRRLRLAHQHKKETGGT